jgi:hypothetical protein
MKYFKWFLCVGAFLLFFKSGNGNITLKYNLMNFGGEVWAGLIWLRVGATCGLL